MFQILLYSWKLSSLGCNSPFLYYRFFFKDGTDSSSSSAVKKLRIELSIQSGHNYKQVGSDIYP